MCGLFAYVTRDAKTGPDLGRLRDIAAATMARGPHAFGFAWIDSQGRLKCYKQTGRIVDHLGLLAMAKDARMLIGHCRYATHGSYAENSNNHPHPADGGWIVHNGVIGNYRKLIECQELHPVSECDSEVLGLLIERKRGTMSERCAAAVRETSPGPLAMMGLWSRPRRMIVVRRGNPLHFGMGERGTYLASLPHGLPGTVGRMTDDMIYTFQPGRQVTHAAI